MGKKDGNTIHIRLGKEIPEANTTLLALLRDGEKERAGDASGHLADRLGGEVQAFLAEQMRVAGIRGAPVKGTVTITMAFTTGPDGSHSYPTAIKCSPGKVPPGTSMVFSDDDGELTGRPVEPLTELAEKRQRESDNKTSNEPKVGKPANL